MNFSSLASTLYPLIGGGQNKAEFVLNLVDQIMAEPTTERDKELEDKELYNPLEKKTRNTREAYLSGKREIGEKDARTILSRLDPDRFSEYLSGFNPIVNDMLRASDSASKALEELTELREHDRIFDEGHKLFKLAELDIRVANQLRKLFTQNNNEDRIEYYIREYIGDRIEESDVDLSKDSLNDILGFLQTVYESCVENEAYVETKALFHALNDYINLSVWSTSSSSPDKINELRDEIITLLDELDVID